MTHEALVRQNPTVAGYGPADNGEIITNARYGGVNIRLAG
jgi:hypothetical protein